MLTCLLAIAGEAMAQGIHGKVVDVREQPIEGVAVILQTPDSVYVDAVVTDSLGSFRLEQPADRPLRLLFQHLLYATAMLDIHSADAGVVKLADKDYQLGEVTVKADRPQVKLEAGGKLTYDVSRMMVGRTATNAFEVIRDLPGIMERDESLHLVGAARLNIVLNGQLTSLSAEQLQQLLKSMPASRVVRAEIMYNAPARYNVRGALLNVVLSQGDSDTPAWQGEVGADYNQYRRADGAAHVNLLHTNKGLSVDLLLDGSKGRRELGEDMLARHTLYNRVTEIDQHNRGLSHHDAGTARLGVDYAFANKDRLSFAYYLRGNKYLTDRSARTEYRPERAASSVSDSRTSDDTHSATHNVRLQYDSHRALTAGVDFTRFRSPSTLDYLDENSESGVTDMINDSRQTVSRWSLFLNKTHQLGDWSLNWGAQGDFASSDNFADYRYKQGDSYLPDIDERVDNRQKEYVADLFAEVTKSFGERFSATVGLKGEYFKADYINDKAGGERSNLWSEWALFPTASLSYTFSARHILQLNVSSDKSYPTYWELSPMRYPVNSYSEVEGNPTLKPSRSYEGQLVYILRQKYIFLAFCEYEPNYFTQLPYQSDTELRNIFRYENMNYRLSVGLSAIVPFQVGRFWSGRVTLTGQRSQEKNDHFHGMRYDRHALLGAVSMNNTFDLSSKPSLKLTVDGQYVSAGSIQGLYDIGSMYVVSAGLKWSFLGDRASLTLKGDDLFASSIPRSIKIDQGNQWSRMRKLNDVRCLRLSFVWKFGGYKARKHEEVDTSRFGR